MKLSRNLFLISSVVAFIFGILYCLSLVFIPIGIYCFIASKKFRYKADHLIDALGTDANIIKNYAYFVSIVCFPFGLLSLWALKISSSNNIKVETNGFVYENTQNQKSESDEGEKIVSVEPEKHETESEKQEKFEKLQKFFEKGIITEDELEMAREQLFGNSKDK